MLLHGRRALPAFRYYFQKIGGAIDGAPGGFGTMHIHLVAKVIEDFKARLDERGTLQAYSSVVDLIELIEYPIQELVTYFDDVTHSTLNAKGAHIFTFFLYKHIEELKLIAKEIDLEYKSEP